MTIVRTTPDRQSLTFTLVVDLPAPPARLWQLWADPRQLERWWGPPGWPATFTSHDFVPGGVVHYVMAGPGGEHARGWWRFLTLEEPGLLEFHEGFADEGGAVDDTMPATVMRVEIQPSGAGGRMAIGTTFASLPEMEKLMAMGMVEGMAQAVGQIDEVLATS